MINYKHRVGIVLAGGLFANCASAPPPIGRMETTAAAIRSAEELGATKVPSASLHLQLAKEESTRAKKLVDEGDTEQAQRFYMRAEADAELAVALARAQSAKNDTQQSVDRLKTLKPITQ